MFFPPGSDLHAQGGSGNSNVSGDTAFIPFSITLTTVVNVFGMGQGSFVRLPALNYSSFAFTFPDAPGAYWWISVGK